MHCPKDGFLIIEILISFALITGFVVICMRYQAQTLAIQARAVDTLEAVDQLEGILDSMKQHNKIKDISVCKFSMSQAVGPVTMPSMQGNPPNFSIRTAQYMKVMTITLSWNGPFGKQLCRLPMVFKENGDGGL